VEEEEEEGEVVVYFKVLPQHSPESNEGYQKKPQSGQSVYRTRFELGNSRIVRSVVA
jgi:hypothetical protein